MNLSEQSRKEQVFYYLKARINAWIDGPDLANETVGGSEGLKRLREIRVELRDDPNAEHDIEMRGHPDPGRDIHQYRLVDRRGSVYAAPAPASPKQVSNGSTSERPPMRQNALDRRGTHVAYDPVTQTYLAVNDEPAPPLEPPPLPGQTDMGVPEELGYKYEKVPAKLELGRSIPCPMCHGIHRAIKEKDPLTGKAGKGSKVIGYEDQTRNPNKPSQTCPRCNGFGLIPAAAL